MTCKPVSAIAALLFLIVSFSAASQKTGYGFYLGPTLTSLKLEPTIGLPVGVQIDPYDYAPGVVAGGFFRFGIGANAAVRTELNFERKGGRSGMTLSDSQGNPLSRTITDRMDYLQVPVLFQLSSAGDGFQMNILAGYAFGYLLHYTYDFPKHIDVIDEQNAQVLRLLMPEGYKKIDHNLVASVMASIPLDYNRLQIGFRANIGKANLAEGETTFEAHNLTLGLLVGMEF